MTRRLLLYILFAVVPAFAQASSCPSLTQLPNPLQCKASEHGWFYAPDADEAEALANAAGRAATRFEDTFARKPLPGAVIATDLRGLSPGAVDAAAVLLRERGARWVLPWASAASIQREMERQFHQQFRKQNPSARAASARSAAADFARRAAIRTPSTVQHEVGHKLFEAAYWPQESQTAAPQRYGSPAPDWLDEGAAIVMEPDEDAEGRRRLFADMAADQLRSAKVQPLANFLSAAHPRLSDPELPGEIRAQGENRVTVSIGLADNAAFVRTGGYYAQARVWMDFLTETHTGVLDSIATSLAAGQDFTQWLSHNGSDYGLATDMAGLERQWVRWRERRYPGALRSGGHASEPGR